MTMTTAKKRTLLTAALAALFSAPTGLAKAQDDFVNSTPFYEDDAWWDISEWFDGNDYNPTDEAIGRWDNETFEYSSALTSTDQDNDYDVLSDYGYMGARSVDDDWFYDYYDDGYGIWDENYYSVYSDYDDDGLYDAYTVYSDIDGDGFYEEADYYSLNDYGDEQDGQAMARNKQKEMRSNRFKTAGCVLDVKTAKVRDRDHLIARLQTDQGQMVIVDLGTSTTGSDIADGDEVSATGHLVRVGDKRVLMASQANLSSGTKQIERQGQKFRGEVAKTKQVDIRGEMHRFVKLQTEEGKSMMVDLGPKDQLDLQVQNGQILTVQGVPTKVNERRVLMARRVTQDGETHSIDTELASADE